MQHNRFSRYTRLGCGDWLGNTIPASYIEDAWLTGVAELAMSMPLKCTKFEVSYIQGQHPLVPRLGSESILFNASQLHLRYLCISSHGRELHIEDKVDFGMSDPRGTVPVYRSGNIST